MIRSRVSSGLVLTCGFMGRAESGLLLRVMNLIIRQSTDVNRKTVHRRARVRAVTAGWGRSPPGGRYLGDYSPRGAGSALLHHLVGGALARAGTGALPMQAEIVLGRALAVADALGDGLPVLR